ncbi:FMN-dependent NADH-azoreductase 1 [Pseudobythopirellula maris]|uniref:FMN dependent NADH:quinone oxidoreductase n=1 Tax=Pseudobythopirellula maris TaxID=2527991 RepID=A0A5C5ZV85_9BACT|nr:NAD(P)H-dependent oxidoreductase [Pseudobythopirellula maris]TWT91150.1 FMN-dependent NADH-azoreductase 1 [Pseudobythopirellula maris]
MAKLLHIDASPRGERSHSKRLSARFVGHWRDAHPGDSVTYRDIGRNPIPHVTEDWIAGAFTPPGERTEAMRSALALSDELVAELLEADVIVMGVPLYNFGMPSGLKAYVDQIVRVGVTFGFDPQNRTAPYEPLVHGKRMFVVVASGDGGYGPGGPNEKHNHLDPHLRTVFGFIGVTDVTFVRAENDEFGGTALADSLAAAQREIGEIVGASK